MTIRNLSSCIGVLFVLTSIFSTSVFAYSDQKEQTNYYLKVLAGNNLKKKIQVLERLQWSGVTDHGFYDQIEASILDEYQSSDLTKNASKLLGYKIRALGYSGIEKYMSTLELVKKGAKVSRNKKYATKALQDLKRFSMWSKKTAEASPGPSASGKPVEIVNYMKMMNSDDSSVQKLAARAIYHEQQNDVDLLNLTAEKLKAIYLKDGLSGEDQDSAAWLCKALGNNSEDEYLNLLSDVAASSPYRKIKKYAAQYIP